MAAGTLTLSGEIVGEPEGSLTIGPLATPTQFPIGQDETLLLPQGETTVPIPAGTTQVILVPDPTNTVPLSLKKTGSLDLADGLPLSPSGWTAFAPAPELASFDLYADAPVPTPTRIIFY